MTTVTRTQRARHLLRRIMTLPPSQRSCPVCAEVLPSKRVEAFEWIQMWGHRCEHEEPCPGFFAREVRPTMAVCGECTHDIRPAIVGVE
jgi:hypothetical protein